MVSLYLLSALLLTSLSFVPATAVAATNNDRLSASMTLVQQRGEIKTGVDHALESLREEIKKGQEQTEARISSTMVRPLDERIKILEENKKYASFTWGLPTPLWGILSAILASSLAYFLGRLAADQDRKISEDLPNIRVVLEKFKQSLRDNIERQTIEIDYIGNTMAQAMSLLNDPDTMGTSNTEQRIKSSGVFEQLAKLKISDCQVKSPEEMKRYTKSLVRLLKTHKKCTETLREDLGKFCRLAIPAAPYQFNSRTIMASLMMVWLLSISIGLRCPNISGNHLAT